MKKIFGGLNLSWPKVIISAIIIGVLTGLLNSVPALSNTSITDPAIYFDLWILFGILIIMNSESNLDSALKCFIFFLISQPIIYLVEVPFHFLSWQIFRYYRPWFIWTLFCFPMGFLGYYLKKDKLWTLLMLIPVELIISDGIMAHLDGFLFDMPRHILSYIFCITTLIIYPLYIYNNKINKRIGLAISIMIIIAATSIGFINKPIYDTHPLASNEEHYFDNTYKVYLDDNSYGDVNIEYYDAIEEYIVHAKFKKAGHTIITIEDKNGNKKRFNLTILRDKYDVEEIKD